MSALIHQFANWYIIYLRWHYLSCNSISKFCLGTYIASTYNCYKSLRSTTPYFFRTAVLDHIKYICFMICPITFLQYTCLPFWLLHILRGFGYMLRFMWKYCYCVYNLFYVRYIICKEFTKVLKFIFVISSPKVSIQCIF